MEDREEEEEKEEDWQSGWRRQEGEKGEEDMEEEDKEEEKWRRMLTRGEVIVKMVQRGRTFDIIIDIYTLQRSDTNP